MQTIFVALVQYEAEVRNIYDRDFVLIHAERAQDNLVSLLFGTREERQTARTAWRERAREGSSAPPATAAE